MDSKCLYIAVMPIASCHLNSEGFKKGEFYEQELWISCVLECVIVFIMS